MESHRNSNRFIGAGLIAESINVLKKSKDIGKDSFAYLLGVNKCLEMRRVDDQKKLSVNSSSMKIEPL